MKTANNQNKPLHSLIQLLYLFFFAGLIFSLRIASSISIAAILLTGIVIHRSSLSIFFQRTPRTFFLVGCTLLFLLQVIALYYTNNMPEGWANTRIKSGLVITPLAVLVSLPGSGLRKKLFSYYCFILLAATLYCLFAAFLKFLQTGDQSVFFYHELVGTLNRHAVYFSLFVIIGLIFLLESLSKKEFLINKAFTIGLSVFLSGFLFLLSSKFVIAFYLFYLVYFFITNFQKRNANKFMIAGVLVTCIIAASLIFFTRNPISERFSDLRKGNLGVITQDKFAQGDYFNGLQFRLLQWRFVGEILTENKHWWTGVSPGDAQTYLNAKYISKNMYSGDPARGDRGYLAYNTHNQFLETLLQTGLIGLFALLFICFCLIKLMMQEKKRLTSFVILLLIAWLFSESVFETQYGIVIFTFFPLFVSTGEKQIYHQT